MDKPRSPKSTNTKNIQVGFRAADIQHFNKHTVDNKMGASELFQHSIEQTEDSEAEDVQGEGTEDQIQIVEIVEEGLPSPPRYRTQYFVSMEDDSSIPSADSSIEATESSMAEHVESQGLSQFLRLPQIKETRSSKVRSEPIVDYNNSQILTSNEHVDQLITISNKKAMVEEERIAKQRKRTYQGKEG